MIVACEWKSEIQGERLIGAHGRKDLRKSERPETARQLEVTNRGHVNGDIGRLEPCADGACMTRTYGVFDERGCVSNEARCRSRSSLSRRIQSAADTPRSIGSRSRAAAKTSSRGGVATSRSSISSMYLVSEIPRNRARRTSSRWRRSETFLTWIIFAMLATC